MQKYVVLTAQQYADVCAMGDIGARHTLPIPVAVLSTTLLQKEGVYQYVALPEAPTVMGIKHYVGHPATRHILDQMGATHAPGLFLGLQVNQAIYVAQLKDPRKGQAFTVDSPNVGPEDLKWGMVIRLA